MKRESFERLLRVRELLGEAAARVPQDIGYDMIKEAQVQLEAVIDEEPVAESAASAESV